MFGYYVNDPERYGVVQFGADGEVVDLLEKPAKAPSNYAVTGIYFYDERAPALTRGIKPSDARRARDHRPQPSVPARRGVCASSVWVAAPHGSTRAPTIRSWTPGCSSASSRSARA